VSRLRAVVSLTLLVLFTISAVTGALLILLPHGKGAGSVRENIAKLYTVSSILILIPAIIHIYLNSASIKLYLKNY